MTKPMGVLIAVLALVVTAGAASAQVAAPTLNPVHFPNLFRQNNPATVPWRAHSYAGATLAELEFDAAGAPVSPAAEGNGRQLDLNWIGPMFGVELSRFEFTVNLDPALGTGDQSLGSTNVLLGLRMGDLFGIGVGHERKEDKSSTNPGSDEAMTFGGVNLRLLDVLFLGAASGTAKGTKSGGGDYDQAVTRYGIGLLLGQANRFHVEWFHESREAFADIGLSVFQDGLEVDGWTLEALLGSLLLGYLARDSESVDTNGNVVGGEHWKTTSVGWYPAAGFSLGVFLTQVEIAGGGPSQVDMKGLSVGWAF